MYSSGIASGTACTYMFVFDGCIRSCKVALRAPSHRCNPERTRFCTSLQLIVSVFFPIPNTLVRSFCG